MKYRAVEYRNGDIIVEYKTNFFSDWRFYSKFSNWESAMEFVVFNRETDKKRKEEYKASKKIVRIWK